MSDGSLASQVEDWMVTRILAITHEGSPAFEALEVEPWNGSNSGSVPEFAKELFDAQRHRLARVFFLGERTVELADDEMKVEPEYMVLIGMKNLTGGAEARRGEVRGSDKLWGTNAMRAYLQAAFNQQRPNLDDGVSHTDKTHYRGSEIVLMARDSCIMRAIVVVDEAPKQG